MGLSTAERNRRKRERKKKEREEERQRQEAAAAAAAGSAAEETKDVEIEYVAEPPPQLPDDGAAGDDALEAVRRFQERASAAVVSDDEKNAAPASTQVDAADRQKNEEDEEEEEALSKRKLREKLRPTVAELKRRVQRPDLVEAHDVTAMHPEFLIQLKAVTGTVPVPRHWGRKRKYLQGKRGFEKPPFQLPDFILKTGIAELRDHEEEDISAKQKNRMRVAPKMGAIEIDYRQLHDAFFKHQTKPTNLTKFGDLYYEGKELEIQTDSIKPGGSLSPALREALNMTSDSSPPPWLINMQRYGPPPSYPGLKIPGLNAPLPTVDSQYGYHPGGWGKPPVDQYGRPLYGGNPFDPPGTKANKEEIERSLVTSDGKTVAKTEWGALPTGVMEEEEEEESSVEEMEESSEEEEEEEPTAEPEGMASVLPPPSIPSTTAAQDLRKQPGIETPVAAPPKQLYTVIEQKKAAAQAGAVFASEVAYEVKPTAAKPPEGAESVLSKVQPASGKRKRKDEDEEEELGQNFKF